MANIIIRFVTQEDVESIAIRAYTWCAFSHVEFVLDDGTTLGARTDHNPGVQIRPINYAKFSNEERYNIPVTDEQKAIIMAFAHAQVGKPYDVKDIFGIFTHRDWRDDGSWICSELVTAAFEKGGVYLLNSQSEYVNRVTPADDYLSPMLRGNRIWPI